jgi:hypothetical protein
VDSYLDPVQFLLSTQVPPISLDQQMMIDAINQDDLTEMQEMGRPLNEEQRQILLELLVKADLRKQLKAQREQRRVAQLQPPQQAPAAQQADQQTADASVQQAMGNLSGRLARQQSPTCSRPRGTFSPGAGPEQVSPPCLP